MRARTLIHKQTHAHTQPTDHLCVEHDDGDRVARLQRGGERREELGEIGEMRPLEDRKPTGRQANLIEQPFLNAGL